MYRHLPLLIHFCTWRHTINGHVQYFTRSHNIEQTIDALKNRHHHFVLVLWRRFVFWMGAGMNDAIHVQVEVVKFNVVGIGQ